MCWGWRPLGGGEDEGKGAGVLGRSERLYIDEV